jgi:hypothetical protein
MLVVERIVVDVVTKYECAHRELIGEVGGGAFLIVWELMI